MALLFLLATALTSPAATAASPQRELTVPATARSHLGSAEAAGGRLDALLSRLAALPVAEAGRLARRWDLRLRDGRVLVEARPLPGRQVADIDVAALPGHGASVQKRSDHVLRLWVPLDKLASVTGQMAGLGRLCVPRLAHTTVVSEGVALSGADDWQQHGWSGGGVKIGIIDAGFIGLGAAKAAGEIPASAVEHDAAGGGMESDTEHGTAVAEAVYDMAPEAQLYLIHIRTNADLADAVDYCIDQDVDIISVSLAWFNFNHEDGVSYTTWTEPYLGPSPISSMNEAAAAGILPVVAAGNYAMGHYSGLFDDNGEGIHDFGGGDLGLTIYADAGETIYGALNWDAWPLTDQDFDLELYRKKGNRLVAWSYQDQESGRWPPPEEFIVYDVPAGGQGYYFFVFRKWSASYRPHFEFFCARQDIVDWPVSSGSISTPADAAVCLAVGAISRLNWTSGPQEAFSSQGPTNQPLIKPDIMGPDSCGSFTWGHWLGTSQATPHVAAAAALVGSRWMSYSWQRVRQYLQWSAVNMGSPGQDTIYGFGRLNLWAVGDLDHDCDVDLADYDLLVGQLQGPGVTVQNDEADLDGDGDCDLADVAIFAGAMSGSGSGCP